MGTYLLGRGVVLPAIRRRDTRANRQSGRTANGAASDIAEKPGVIAPSAEIIDEVLRIGDAATGTRVLEDLYLKTKTTPLTPDLDRLWARLGVPNDPKSQPFDAHAPLAAIRVAITAPQSEHRGAQAPNN